ncbi:MAG UNVERIFIED_CONTAM: hypothetical protein LVR18_29670 [Planctomycetaceae bacterium]
MRFAAQGVAAGRDVGIAFARLFARRLSPNGVDFLARGSAGRAKLLLSRIPAASVSSIRAASQKRWQSLTARTSVRRLGRSLALPSLCRSVDFLARRSAGRAKLLLSRIPAAGVSSIPAASKKRWQSLTTRTSVRRLGRSLALPSLCRSVDFLARRSAGRAKLLLSRIPAAGVSSIPAASKKRWQSLTARTSVRRLGRSLALPSLCRSVDFLARRSAGRAKLLLSRIPAAGVSSIPAASKKRWQSLTTRTSVRRLGRSLALPSLCRSVDFLARRSAGRAKLLLSRIPAAGVSSIPAASKKRWQSLTTRTSVRRLGRSLALPSLCRSVDFLARRSAGRAKLLLSRIPAASVSSIRAASQKRWQSLTARTSVRRLGRSLALPSLCRSVDFLARRSAGRAKLLLSRIPAAGVSSIPAASKKRWQSLTTWTSVRRLGRSLALPSLCRSVDFLARRSAGRAKLLLSRIPAASVSSIRAASQKRWQSLTARTSVRRLGRSLALPSLCRSVDFLARRSAGRAKLLLSRIPAAGVSSIPAASKNAGNRSQRGPAFGGSAGASPSHVFARPLTFWQGAVPGGRSSC